MATGQGSRRPWAVPAGGWVGGGRVVDGRRQALERSGTFLGGRKSAASVHEQTEPWSHRQSGPCRGRAQPHFQIPPFLSPARSGSSEGWHEDLI